VKVRQTPLSGVVVIETAVIADHRGAFTRLFCDRELSSLLGARRIVQINHSVTRVPGAVRGMHFQNPPHAEMKFVRCLRGRVWDVAIDLRRGSPTFLQWHAEELSPDGSSMMVIPEGCAHGFQVLEPESELLYLHTAHYEKSAEAGVRYNDPRVDIVWPLDAIQLSDRDKNHPRLDESFSGISL